MVTRKDKELAIENFKRFYTTFRKYQKEAIEKACELLEKRKYLFLSAPTGIGKSAINMSLLLVNGGYYVTGLLSLQDQICKDFQAEEIYDIRGKENYECRRGGKCRCVRDKCELCVYKYEKAKALSSFVTVTNIFWIMSNINSLKKKHLCVIDEAHNLPEILVNYGRVTLSEKNCFSIFPIIRRCRIEDIPSYLYEYANNLADFGDDERASKLLNLAKRIEVALQTKVIDVVKSTKREIIPLYADRIFEKFDFAERFIFSSATINPDYMIKELGLNKKDCAIIKIPSLFPPERRPIVALPICDFDLKHQEENAELIANVCRKIIEKHKGEKGIIFVPGYRYYDYFKDMDRVIFLEENRRDEILREWMESDDDKVLVGVKLEEGLDLKYDLCRFAIIVKAPFPDVSDLRVKFRLEKMKQWKWFYSLAENLLVQAYGRLCRAEDDFGILYILDKKAIALLKRKTIPKWVKSAIIKFEPSQLTLGGDTNAYQPERNN